MKSLGVYCLACKGLFLFFSIIFCAVGSGNEGHSEAKVREFEFPLMGTRYAIRGEGISPEDFEGIKKLGAKINSACSDYDVTSELSKLNEWPANEEFLLSPILYDVLKEALTISKFTNGAYDPTVGWHTWNWRKSRRDKKLPSTKGIEKASLVTGWHHLILDDKRRVVTKKVRGMRIDLGGVAKGYAADRMLEYLNARGLMNVSVVAGGDLRLGDTVDGDEGWTVVLETLDRENKLTPKRLLLERVGVSTSGDLHQWIDIEGKRYSHIVDARTGLGLRRRISATVIAKNATWSDALATALCVNSKLLERLEGLDGIEGLVVFEGDSGELEVLKSKKFPKVME